MLAGAQPGERAVLVADASHYFYVAEIAILKAGLVKVPLNHRLNDDEVMDIIRRSEASVAIASTAGALKDRGADLPSVRTFIPTSRGSAALPDIGQLIDSAPEMSVKAGRGPEDPCALMFSSGSSGEPKGIVQSHRGMVLSAQQIIHAFRIGRDDRHLVATSPAHAHGYMYPGLFSMGATTVLLDGFDPETVLQAIEVNNITSTSMVPTMWYRVLDCPSLDRRDMSSLRHLSAGSAPMSPGRVEQVIGRFGPIFGQTYAQSESPLIMTQMEPHDYAAPTAEESQKRLQSCGRESLMVQIRILGPDDNEVPPGEAGEIVFSNPAAMIGYWRNEELTAKIKRNGWIYSGDIGYRDERDYIYLVDRRNDMIISGGFNVMPTEVERLIETHPAVAEAAVIGVPHEVWGETVLAYVRVKPGAEVTAESIIQFCKERSATFKCPTSVIFLDSLPKNDVGKVSRRILREQHWKSQSRQIA